MHSVTKLIGGHSDLTLGVVVGPREPDRPDPGRRLDVRPDGQPVRKLAGAARPGDPQPAIGPRQPHGPRTGGPPRGPSRSRRGCSTRASRRIPISSWPAACSRNGFGAMVTFDVGGREQADRLIRILRHIPFAPSLGDVQTTLSHPCSTSHRGQDPHMLERLGITPGLIRLSVGLEDPEDLWSDLLLPWKPGEQDLNTSGFADAVCASEWLNLRGSLDRESDSLGPVILLENVFKRERTRLRQSAFAQACFNRSRLDGPLVGFSQDVLRGS